MELHILMYFIRLFFHLECGSTDNIKQNLNFVNNPDIPSTMMEFSNILSLILKWHYDLNKWGIPNYGSSMTSWEREFQDVANHRSIKANYHKLRSGDFMRVGESLSATPCCLSEIWDFYCLHYEHSWICYIYGLFWHGTILETIMNTDSI